MVVVVFSLTTTFFCIKVKQHSNYNKYTLATTTTATTTKLAKTKDAVITVALTETKNNVGTIATTLLSTRHRTQ